MAKEEALWTAWGKRDAETFRKNLTSDAAQIGSSGAYTGLESILDAMGKQSCSMSNFDADKIQMRRLSKDVIVLNYAYTQKGACNGVALPARVMATSIYVQKEGRWLSAHYHESPLN
jgi:uncharacterized protein (TIGR02246 family)